jgi:L-aspartate oxidase
MKHYHEAGELAPRDVVARAIVSEMQKTQAEFVYLDMTGRPADFVMKRFPRIHATCLQYGVDITADLIPVRPAAHYSMGGVVADLQGRTSLPGLFAAGETAATGVHGANRLASNSLLEGLVYGARAGKAMAEGSAHARKRAAAAHGNQNSVPANRGRHADNPGHGSENSPSQAMLHEIRALLWKDVGILRDGKSLQRTVEHLAALKVNTPAPPSRAACELHNVWTLAQLIAQSAVAREESRGSHYRSDFPYRNDEAFQKYSRIASGKKVWFE